MGRPKLTAVIPRPAAARAMHSTHAMAGDSSPAVFDRCNVKTAKPLHQRDETYGAVLEHFPVYPDSQSGVSIEHALKLLSAPISLPQVGNEDRPNYGGLHGAL